MALCVQRRVVRVYHCDVEAIIVKHPFGNRRRIAFGRRLFFGAKLLFIPHQVNDSILRRKDRLWPQGTPSGGRQSLLHHIN